MKNCPFCAEEIQDAAIVCKHCGRDLNASVAPAQAVAQIGLDTTYLDLQNEVRDLNAQKAKQKPVLYFLIAAVGLLTAFVLFPTALSWLAGLIGLAGLFAGITAGVKVSSLNVKITDAQTKLDGLKSLTP